MKFSHKLMNCNIDTRIGAEIGKNLGEAMKDGKMTYKELEDGLHKAFKDFNANNPTCTAPKMDVAK